MTEEVRNVPRGVRRGRRGRFASALPGDVKGVLVHLDRDLVALLDARAAASCESRSVLIRRLLKLALDQGDDGEQRGTPAGEQGVPRVAVARSQTPQNTLPLTGYAANRPMKFRSKD